MQKTGLHNTNTMAKAQSLYTRKLPFAVELTHAAVQRGVVEACKCNAEGKKKFVRAVEPREGNVFADVQLPDWDKSIGS
jgi:hypothetical protein